MFTGHTLATTLLNITPHTIRQWLPLCIHIFSLMIAIGSLIKQRVDASGMTVKAFSERLGILRPNAYRIFTAQSIDTNLLMQICIILNHNFFDYYTAAFQASIKKK